LGRHGAQKVSVDKGNRKRKQKHAIQKKGEAKTKPNKFRGQCRFQGENKYAGSGERVFLDGEKKDNEKHGGDA